MRVPFDEHSERLFKEMGDEVFRALEYDFTTKR